MANAFFPAGLAQMWDWILGDNARPDGLQLMVGLLDDTYVYDSTDVTIGDVGITKLLASAIPLSGFAFVGGVLKADNAVFIRPSLPGKILGGVILFFQVTDDSVTATTLLALIDTAGISIPQSLSEGNVTIFWKNGNVLQIG